MRLTKNFTLSEFLPKGMDEKDVPPAVAANILTLATQFLQPMREHFGVVVDPTSGYRPPKHNATVGGVAGGDHERGAAVDFYLWESKHASWEENTIEAFNWLRVNMDGDYGQLILEDHRAHLGDPGKLWVHLALKSEKHPGTSKDKNRLLVSYAPRTYMKWQEGTLA